MLSAPSLDSIFELSNHAGSVNSEVEESDQNVVVGAFQLLLSEAESDTHVGDSEEEKYGEGGLLNATLSLPESTMDDVNFFKDGEDTSAYEKLDSCGSDSDDESDEAVVEPREYPDDADMSDEETTHVDEAFLEPLGGSLDIDHIDSEALRNTRWGSPISGFEPDASSYPNLSRDVGGIIGELRDQADSPLSLFFVPKELWIKIATETHQYKRQSIGARASRMRANQVRLYRPSTPETVAQIRRRLRLENAYDLSEILHVMGLLIAQVLCPHKRRFSSHWSMADDGAVPAGIFGRFMARNRCTSILRDLHFVNNEAPHVCDRLRKLRPVVNVLTRRFQSRWSLPAVFSFDEGELPSTSRRNTTRICLTSPIAMTPKCSWSAIRGLPTVTGMFSFLANILRCNLGHFSLRSDT
ncbi:unnamed protein product [Phytophthora fragariaefolia]|uniref:Unnamed protein product n=1 Tax=Phytophthora fragariaefolia TaxID=1490495 RepID=A0A9W7CZB9_9STRA|nr:unnamed protein product [Phytophthora fragariaefolia]